MNIKVTFTDLAMSIENSDEIMFSSQFYSAEGNQIYIDIDEHRRVTFRTAICLGTQYPVLK